MVKLFKGDLLIFTPNGFKKADELNIGDQILSLDINGNLIYDEIEEITKTFKKKYTLNKIDNYFINNYIQIYSMNNIPLNYEKKELEYFIKTHTKNCIGNISLNDLSIFDYIGFPIKKDDEVKNSDIDYKEMGKKINETTLTLNELFNLSKLELFNEDIICSHDILFCIFIFKNGGIPKLIFTAIVSIS